MLEHDQRSFFPSLTISSNGLKGKLLTLLRPVLWRLAAMDKISDIYGRIRTEHYENAADPFKFIDKTLHELGVEFHVSREDYLKIPKNGSLIVVSNHPYGGLDGLILAAILGKIRKDLKILANYLLKAIIEIQDLLVYVDPFEKNHTRNRNIGAVRKSIQWVQSGGALAIFPSGEVSGFDIKTGMVSDPPWNHQLAGLIHKTSCGIPFGTILRSNLPIPYINMMCKPFPTSEFFNETGKCELLDFQGGIA